MEAIDELLKLKGQLSYSITTDAPIVDTIQLAARKEVEALVNLEAGKLVMMVSQGFGDRKLILAKKSLNETLLRGIISRIDIHTSDEWVSEAPVGLPNERLERRLPILLDGFPIGTISMGDLASIILSEQEGLGVKQ